MAITFNIYSLLEETVLYGSCSSYLEPYSGSRDHFMDLVLIDSFGFNSFFILIKMYELNTS